MSDQECKDVNKAERVIIWIQVVVFGVMVVCLRHDTESLILAVVGAALFVWCIKKMLIICGSTS